MGMAASQARLLTITARLADNELRSQTINNAKMRLATQSSQASENYINALNDATMKFSNYDETGNSLIQDLTFNSLTAYSSYNTQYGLVNSSGQILVSETEAALFEDSKGNVNAYLKSHGLEFTTSYFEEVGSITNDKYPEPFNVIDQDTLQTYYEQYGSYENSIELERYEQSYSNYRSACSLLSTAASESMKKYLLAGANNPKIKIESGVYSMDDVTNAGSIGAAYNTFKNGFTVNNTTYNINNLAANGFITTSSQTEILGLINNISMDGSNLKYKEALEVTSTTSEDGSATTYNFYNSFTITTDASGNVTVGATAISTDGTLAFGTKDGTALATGQSLSAYLNNLKVTITDEDGNTGDCYYETGTDTEGNTVYYGYNLISDLDAAKELLNDAIDTIIREIVSNANYEGFADWLLSQNTASGLAALSSQYGINPNESIAKAGDMTLSEVLDNYADMKSAFIGNIFDETTPVTIDGVSYASSYEYIEQAMKAGTIDAESLTDVDTVLQMIKDYGLQMSSSYETVCKSFIIEDMIAVYGEPKYAWVDENDTSNTGNADAKAQWYTNLFKRMQKGYKTLENGLASSKQWIEYALESGIVSMEQVDKSYNWTGLDYKTCTRITEETDDEAVTKAEAEYNRAMNDIEAKDNIYDIQLKNIDTEHTSLQTEYDSIKGVISKNIDRTFKFNQSA